VGGRRRTFCPSSPARLSQTAGTRRRRRSCAPDGGVISVQSGCAALEPAPRYCGGAALLTRVAGGPGATRFARCAGRQTGHEGVHSPRQALVCRIRLLSLAALRRRVPGMISGRAPLAQATSISCSSTPVSPGYLRHAAPSRAIYRTSTRYTLLLLRWSPSGGAPTPMVLRSAVALLDTFRGGGRAAWPLPRKLVHRWRSCPGGRATTNGPSSVAGSGSVARGGAPCGQTGRSRKRRRRRKSNFRQSDSRIFRRIS